MSNALRNWEIKSGFPFGEGLTLEELADGAGDILLDMPKIIATARAEALREAAERVTEEWLTTNAWRGDITLAVVRTAILADKQESK